MIEMLKRHEIQVLRRAGHTLEDVAKLAGVAQSSVQRVEAEAPVMTLDTVIRALRPHEAPRPLVRFEGLPGEFSQHDFGQVDVRFVNAVARHVHFFASRLKYSRWAQVSLVEDERVESLLRALVEHLSTSF